MELTSKQTIQEKNVDGLADGILMDMFRQAQKIDVYDLDNVLLNAVKELELVCAASHKYTDINWPAVAVKSLNRLVRRGRLEFHFERKFLYLLPRDVSITLAVVNR